MWAANTNMVKLARADLCIRVLQMRRHPLALSPPAQQDRAAAVAQKTDDAQGPTPAAGTAVENGGEKANGDLASEHANPDAINALDVHEASSTMAYTHVGSSDHSIFIGPLPPVAA